LQEYKAQSNHKQWKKRELWDIIRDLTARRKSRFYNRVKTDGHIYCYTGI
jgi:hypothetical protein